MIMQIHAWIVAQEAKGRKKEEKRLNGKRREIGGEEKKRLKGNQIEIPRRRYRRGRWEGEGDARATVCTNGRQ
jgi:hypothetical protein